MAGHAIASPSSQWASRGTGQLVLRTGWPKGKDIAVSGAWVVRDGAGWRAWYTGWNGDERSLGGGRVEAIHHRIGLATSPDGLRWTKRRGPAGEGSTLGLGRPGDADALAAAHPSVVKAGPTYHLWYEAYDGTARIMDELGVRSPARA